MSCVICNKELKFLKNGIPTTFGTPQGEMCDPCMKERACPSCSKGDYDAQFECETCNQTGMIEIPKKKKALSTHPCAIPECKARIKPEMLMCGKHWRMVPPQIKRAILKHYRKGQNISTATDAYMGAYHAAVGAVQQKENSK